MNNSFSPTCSQCGGQIQLPKGRTRIKCPYCGTEQVLTGDVAQQVQMEGAHICRVYIKDDKLEKVSAIVAREDVRYSSPLGKMLKLPKPEYEHIDPSKPPVRPMSRQAAQDVFLTEKSPAKPVTKNKSNAAIVVGIIILAYLCFWGFIFWASRIRLNSKDVISLLIATCIGAAGIIMIKVVVMAFDPNQRMSFWDVVLPTIIMLLFAVFIASVSFIGEQFEFSMLIFGVGVGIVGIRFFVAQFPKTQNREEESSIPLSTSSPNTYKPPTFEQEWEQYQHNLKSYERYKAAIQEKEKIQHSRVRVWIKHYYCSRDDIVILPAKGLYTPARDMEAFVNIQANQRNRK